MEPVRTHLCGSADPITLHPVDQKAEPDMKPLGFWYEVDGDWRRWCSDEQWGIEARHLHAVELGDTKVLVLDTLDKLDAFHERYAKPLRGMSLEHRSDAIDWMTVSRHYDGIEIAPYQWGRRFGWLWYYGWDCASGCIWRPNGAEVTHLVELPADWHATEAVEADAT